MQQRFKRAFLPCLLIAFCSWAALNPVQGAVFNQENVSLVDYDIAGLDLHVSTLTLYHSEKDSIKNKVIASILAFPYPFGMLGLHRIYLGANPIIPILYFVTFGGLMGILPFIDMMVLILSKDTKPFFKNSKILMWNKENK